MGPCMGQRDFWGGGCLLLEEALGEGKAELNKQLQWTVTWERCFAPPCGLPGGRGKCKGLPFQRAVGRKGWLEDGAFGYTHLQS